MSSTISGQTQGFTALVSGQVNVVQAAALPTAPLDFTTGSVLRAIVEGAAWLGLWLQGLILQVLSLTRAATSNGSDLDSWMADFTLTRIAATYATGQVVFSAYTPPSQAATIPVGTMVTTGDGSQTFAVIADPSQPCWNASANAYILAVGTSSATVTVQASTAGTAGDVAAGQISLLATPISGIDSVVNATALGGGVAAETDAAFRTRFANFINTRSLSTAAAVGYAVSTVPGVVSYALTQNYDLNGTYDPGSIYVVVDDGSGNPPGTLISLASAAIDSTIGCGIRFSVYPPTLVAAGVSMTLVTQSGYNHATIVAAVQSAVTAYVNALPVGGTLAFNRLPQVAFDAAPGISNIEGLLLNGGTSDIVATPQQVIRTTSVVVS
jgi:uncharacterized phage protein gp47/JayE